MNQARVEIENPIIRDWPSYPKFRFPTVHALTCGCDSKATYYVNDQLHCTECMLEATSTHIDVRVRTI